MTAVGSGGRPAVRRLFARLVPAGAPPGPVDLLLALLAAVAAAVVSLTRQPGSALHTPWAEDGRVFLSAAWREGASSLLDPYAGYLHLFPRTTALLAANLPVHDAAGVLAVAGVLPAALLAGTAVVAPAAFVRSTALRAVLGLFVVVLPFAGAEVAANVANGHWFFMAAAALTLAWRTTWRPAAWWTAGVLVLATLSDPLTGLLLPVALVRLLAGPAAGDRRRRWAPVVAPVAVLLAGLAVQAGPALGSFGATAADRPTPAPADLFRELVRHVPAVVLVGESSARAADNGTLVASVAAVVLAVVVVAVRRPALVPAVLVGVVLAAVYWLTPNELRRVLQVRADGLESFAANSRYAVVPLVLLATVLLAALDALVGGRGPATRPATGPATDPASGRASGGPGHGRVRTAATLGLALAAAAWVVHADVPDLGLGVTREPSWDSGVAAATRQCRARPGGATDIPIAPARWTARIPCSRLLR